MDIDICRHSLAHVLAMAVKKLLPSVHFGIGPAIETGFYYDFLVPEGSSISVDILDEIQREMERIIKEDFPFEQSTLLIDEAKAMFRKRGEDLKLELIDDIEKGGDTKVSIYTTGNFVDLCRGPHVPSTKELRNVAFQMDRVAGAYWRGDEKRPMLQRIYALAYPDKKELANYIAAREEAARRDHRKLGTELKLFTNSEDVGKGLPLLLPKGATLRRVLERFAVDEELRRGYLHVYTPDLGRKYLYEISGHWEHYKDSMYPPLDVGGQEICLRPMSCPHHFMIYKSEPRTYRELPLRYAEIATQYRREQSGELSGLIRMMSFHLADAHIICRPDQLQEEFLGVVELVRYMMRCLGLSDVVSYRASLHGEQKDKYVDNPELWATSEKILLETLDAAKLDYTIAEGEAAFYGPKLDVQIRSVLGREDTIFTIQIDFALPERFDMTYRDSSGQPYRPVVIHRSSVGCIERTMAFLIEYYAGAFPCWLAPVQVMLMTVSDGVNEYASRIRDDYLRAGIRCESDLRNETIGKKIREGRLQRIPYLGVIGKKEAENQTLSVRNRNTGNQAVISTEEFKSRILKEIAEYSLTLSAECLN